MIAILREQASREFDEKAVPALVKALEHSDPEVKSRAEEETLEKYPVVRDLKIRREILDLLDDLDRENLTRLPKYGRRVEIGEPAAAAICRIAASEESKPAVRHFLLLLLGGCGKGWRR